MRPCRAIRDRIVTRRVRRACYVLRPDGTRVRRAVCGKTRKDVADQLAVLIAKTKAGLPLAVESWTLERFAEHWLTHVVGLRLRPSTLSSYRETLRLHVLPTLGCTNLRSLTPTHVRTLLANKQPMDLARAQFRSFTAPCAQCSARLSARS
jgi:hypothetical protein